MTMGREALAVLTVWTQCALVLALSAVVYKLICGYWQDLMDAKKVHDPETIYRANTIWKPR